MQAVWALAIRPSPPTTDMHAIYYGLSHTHWVGYPPATRHTAPALARSVLHLCRAGCPPAMRRAAPRAGRALRWRGPRAASAPGGPPAGHALGVEWGAAMVARPRAPRGTSITGVGGGRHGVGGGGAVRSRPAGAQSRRRLIEGAPCGEECWGREKIKKSDLGPS